MHREVVDYQIQHKWLPEQKNVALDHPKAQLKKKKQRKETGKMNATIGTPLSEVKGCPFLFWGNKKENG